LHGKLSESLNKKLNYLCLSVFNLDFVILNKNHLHPNSECKKRFWVN
jgi:hypothetical protein